MILPIPVITKAYTTLRSNKAASRSTCTILNTQSSNFDCLKCPAFSGSTKPGSRCGFHMSNPDFDLQFKLFFDEYPEYAI